MHKPSEIKLQENPPQLAEINLTNVLPGDKEHYEKQLKKLQLQMLTVQQAYYYQNRRAIIVFEGWDCAGKGGNIRRLTEKLDPRGFQVHPISAPTSEEQGTHYLYRFQRRLPSPGNICIFDRSYFGRVLVERVEGFASKAQWQRAYQEINEFERLLMDDGVRIVKLFLHIDKKEQLRRFEHRLREPLKRWKLTDEDIRNHKRWDEYELALADMFQYTSTEAAPWTVIPTQHKWYGRINVLTQIIEQLSQGIDISPPPLDPLIAKFAFKQLGISAKKS